LGRAVVMTFSLSHRNGAIKSLGEPPELVHSVGPKWIKIGRSSPVGGSVGKVCEPAA